jgi:hypothetical protein
MTVSVTLPARIAHHHLRLGARMMIKSTPSTCVPSIMASAVSPITTSMRQRSLAGYGSQAENLCSPQDAAAPVTGHPAAYKSVGASTRRIEAPFIRRTGRPERQRSANTRPAPSILWCSTPQERCGEVLSHKDGIFMENPCIPSRRNYFFIENLM